MKRKLFLMGMLVLVPTFGLVLAGCATTPPTPDKLAVQLAADINAIKAGSATADGDTVRLTGEVYLKTGLTVPAGVTLDLTADKVKFELQNGATLTVEGTVNTSGHGDHGSGWVEGGGLRIDEGTAVINGSGTINLKSKGCVLNVWGDKKHLTLDGVTLVGIKDNDRSLVNVDNGGEFVLKSGAITGNTRIGEGWTSGGGVSVNKGVFRMDGGTITDNSAMSNKESSNGGGVNIGKEAVFTMTGGTITGNTAENGGGVRIEENGTFTMEGGTISGNTASNDHGGGVFVQNGTFTLKGGKISGNSANNRGGGVFIQSVSVFTMEGGEISDNSGVRGGGVSLQGPLASERTVLLFTMSGGIISGNNASMGGGIRASNVSTLTISGGRIQGNTDSDGFIKNTSTNAVIDLGDSNTTAKWGTGGVYTKGGVSQTGGSNIGSTDDTLIAIPAR